MNKAKFGFTLAEVLITLGIIGVVAAITLPILINEHKKTVYVNQLKKTVNTLENGFKLAMAQDNSDKLTNTELWLSRGNCNSGDPYDTKCNAFFQNMKKYFIFENAENRTTPRTFHTLKNTPESGPLRGLWHNEIIMPNGTFISFMRINGGPSTGIFGPFPDVATLSIDVNGPKRPNQLGRDVFTYGVTEYGQVIPYGSVAAVVACKNAGLDSSCVHNFDQWVVQYTWSSTSNSWSCESIEKDGYFCAARIMEKG